MKKIYFHFYLLILTTIFSENLIGQDSLNTRLIFPYGISLEYGLGSLALTDEYISNEKYSGPTPCYGISWANPYLDHVYQIKIDYRYSSKIKNNTVNAYIHQFSLNQDFSFILPKFMLFEKEVYTFLGPRAEIFFYYNKQNIAVSGFDYSLSFAFLISGGVSSNLFYKFADDFYFETSLDLSLISLGGRMVDMEKNDELPVKILSLFSGTNLNFRLGARYYLSDNLSVKAAYLFNLTRISSWKPLLSTGDNLLFTLTYGF